MDETAGILDADPEGRVEFALARARFASVDAARAMARQLAAIGDTIAEAREFPHVFLGPGRHDDRESQEFAVRAAVAEIATTLGVSEGTVRVQLGHVEILRTRLRSVWVGLFEGEISYQNARVLADEARLLPDDDHTVWEAFDDALAGPAATRTAAQLRQRARATRERLHPQPLEERHASAREGRRAWIEAADDGMAWLGALTPADDAQRAWARIDATARHLSRQPGEERTLEQLRADVLCDILTGEGTGNEVRATVFVTVPALTLIDDDGADDGAEAREPGILDGFGPISPDVARRLAAKAPSFYRILTHPVTSTVLDIDRAHYRPPADLKRWLERRDHSCSFPGCTRAATECDIDHVTDWQYNGTTSEANLANICRNHHRLKHNTAWKVRRDTVGGTRWISPTGQIHTTDPPPF